MRKKMHNLATVTEIQNKRKIIIKYAQKTV